ncbi:MAG: ABC transporter [Planctomycetaceae bacterium]|nr:ABC transporter [Planctomycetaceae bacterium]
MMHQNSKSEPTLEVEDLAFGYGPRQPVIDGLSLCVDRGRVHAVLGCSGCGKTTLLRLIAGLERLERGRIRVDGVPLAGDGVHLAPERRPVGMVFQDYALFPHRTARRNVLFGIRGGTRRERIRRADETLDSLGVLELADRMPHTLSGGQQQRIALARSLVRKPRVMLLDEPFSSLDAETRTKVRTEILGVLRASGVATLIVTHDPAEAEAVADSTSWVASCQTGPRFVTIGDTGGTAAATEVCVRSPDVGEIKESDGLKPSEGLRSADHG